MATMIVRFRVEDFDRWKRVFDAMAPVRREHGIVGASIHRDAGDPGRVVTILTAGSLEEARAWGRSEALHRAMEDGGVTGTPDVQLLEDVP